MTVAPGPAAIPDSTGPTFALLRELRRGRARKQAASIAFWIYLALFTAAVWGGSLIVAAYRALRHPPPPTEVSLRVLHAAPAGLTALALLVLLLLLRDALWRGPVTVPGATVGWLLGTGCPRPARCWPARRWASCPPPPWWRWAWVAGTAVTCSG